MDIMREEVGEEQHRSEGVQVRFHLQALCNPAVHSTGHIVVLAMP